MKACADLPAVRRTEIRVAGKTLCVPSVEICGRTVVATGTWLRMSTVMDEELVEGDPVSQPARFLEELRASGLRADIFSFGQRPPATTPAYDYPLDWDSWAVIPITSFDAWWKSLPQESRKNVRRAGKHGVVVRTVPFDDDLVRGIHTIYNESPVRQGRPFWHFGKDLAAVKRENATYLDRSDFIGAYREGELIGFIKVIYVAGLATIIQIIAKNAYHEHRPMNALLAATVELCAARGMSGVVYGRYVYRKDQPTMLTEFKRRNGFQEVKVPRYYVPLTPRGRLAIAWHLHTGVRDRIPAPLMSALRTLRARLYDLSRLPSRQPRPMA